MASSDGVDNLFEVRNAFYVGNYQQAINFADKIKVGINFGKITWNTVFSITGQNFRKGYFYVSFIHCFSSLPSCSG